MQFTVSRKGNAMSQSCAQWRGDIGAYVVGALGPAAAAGLNRHLRACAGCRADYLELVPVRDWLSQFAPADGTPVRHPPGGPPPKPLRPRHHPRRQGLAAAGATVVAAAAVVVTAVSAQPAPPGYHAFDAATGVGGWASLRAAPTGTEISLTITGLSADQRCTLVTVSAAGAAVAATWKAGYGGTARITGDSAIPLSQLTALRIETPAHRLLLDIPVRGTAMKATAPAVLPAR
jgi:putative zinc finger protein